MKSLALACVCGIGGLPLVGQTAVPEDSSLSKRLDADEKKLNVVYIQAQSRLNDSQKQILKNDELNWIPKKDSIPPDDPRRAEVIEQRIQYLEAYGDSSGVGRSQSTARHESATATSGSTTPATTQFGDPVDTPAAAPVASPTTPTPSNPLAGFATPVATGGAPAVLPTTPTSSNPYAGFAIPDPPASTATSSALPTDALGQFNLGVAYANGKGRAKDPIQAAKWYQKAADQGYAPAQFHLGYCYDSTDPDSGVIRDVNQAQIWYRKAADQGYATAQVALGFMYQTGRWQFVQKDGAYTSLPVVQKDEVEAAKWFQEAANQGDANGQWALGNCYLSGSGVPKDISQAISLFSKAADQGNALAQLYLAAAYSTGNGVPQDLSRAAILFRKSADQGNLDAEDSLGWCYANGSGVPKDESEAVTWYRKAADQGDVLAQNNLGVVYERGEGVTQDYGQAFSWYQKAAEQGNALAQNNLGACYDAGNGVAKDESEAVTWFRKAAVQGNAYAQLNLGCCYDRGTGVDEDKPEAAKWYAKAAKQGNQSAQIDLGLLYCKGIGVVKNELEGLAWLYVAAAEGDQDTANHLPFYERLYGGDLALAARKRATEIQAQINSGAGLASNASGAASSTESDPLTRTVKATGSGVFISTDGLFLTAAHVINGSSAVQIVTHQGTLSAKILQVDRANDVALLKCDGTFVSAIIKTSSGVDLGQTVFTLGFPDIQIQGFSPKMTKGEISSISGFQDDPREWQISVPVQSGNSGGPLFDEQGNLVGLIEAKLDVLVMARATGDVPQNVNYALKSAYLMPMLDPYAAELPKVAAPPAAPQKMEDVVSHDTPSIGLVLVY